MKIKCIFAVYGGGAMGEYIEQARSFINSHLTSEFETETLVLGDTPPYHYWEKENCYFLCPWDIPQADRDKLSKDCIAHFLLWKLKEGDKTCHGGGMWGPLTGIHDKSSCSAAYNTWWWDNVSDWHPSLKHGDVIIIHETHHAIMGMLHELLGYGISKSKGEHKYGKTVPHLDFMHDFGYEDGDDYKFTAWAYEQITEEMLTKLRELTVWDPQGCIKHITPGTDINALAGGSVSFSISGRNCGNRKGNTFVIVERDKKGGSSILPLKFEDIEPEATVETTGEYVMPNRDVDIYFSAGHWDWDIRDWITDDTKKIKLILAKTVKNVNFKSVPMDARVDVRKV